MAEHSTIEWTDATWNPITGCSVVSPGCTNCYAMKLAGTRLRNHPSRAGLTDSSRAGPVWNGKVRLNDQWLEQPIHWRRGRNVFVCAHGDLFHEDVPDDWIDAVFAVMALAPQHNFQVLTKRAARMRTYMSHVNAHGETRHEIIERKARHMFEYADAWMTESWPLPNVWMGVSVENQAEADRRIPHLLSIPAHVRFLSCEPLLGPVGLQEWIRLLHWIIAGGESGPSARPSNPQWFRDLRDQCAAAGVPFHFKQHGEWVSVSEVEGPGDHHKFPDGRTVRRTGKKRAGRTLDGVTHDGFPTP